MERAVRVVDRDIADAIIVNIGAFIVDKVESCQCGYVCVDFAF